MLEPEDIAHLRLARKLLESEGLAVKLQNIAGKPIVEGIRWLPEKWNEKINAAVEVALRKSLDTAIQSLDAKATAQKRSDGLHKAMAMASGAVGGAFGLPALLIELPVSTTIMMRSIADIARAEGENLDVLDSRLACVEVFALGGTGNADDYADTGYYAVRAVLAQQVTEAIRHIAQGGAAHASATPIAKLISSIASRFGLVVSEKALAASVPVIGAAGGAMINALFIDHFQDVARGHFIVRRLERKYGKDAVRLQYEKL